MKRQALEERILADLEPLGYRGTSGSGNKFGDGDIKPRFITRSNSEVEPIQLGFECKDRSTQLHHGVPRADWKKACSQIESLGLTAVFVTRNKEGEILAHVEWDDFLYILQRAIGVTN